jgi:hypothetical protein
MSWCDEPRMGHEVQKVRGEERQRRAWDERADVHRPRGVRVREREFELCEEDHQLGQVMSSGWKSMNERGERTEKRWCPYWAEDPLSQGTRLLCPLSMKMEEWDQERELKERLRSKTEKKKYLDEDLRRAQNGSRHDMA